MRIRIKREQDDFPKVLEVVEMEGTHLQVQNSDNLFIMTFYVFSVYETPGCYKRIYLKHPVSDDKDYERAAQTFSSVQTSLTLNGYANLVAGEQTALIDDEWQIDY